MLKNLNQRKRGVKIFLGAILVAISAAMVLTLAPIGGMGTQTGSADAVVTVGGQNITLLDVRQEFDQQTRGQQVPPIMQGLYMQQIVQQMVFKRVLELEAQRLGMQVTDDEVTQRIRQVLPSAFAGGTWVGSERYAQEVQIRTGMSVPQFEDTLRTGLLQDRFQRLVTDGITVTPQELEERYRWENEKVQLSYVQVKPSDLENSINPPDAELSTYFAKNQSKYQVPERRSAKYALLDLATLKQQTKVSDAEIQAYYQTHIDDYKVDNRVHVEHILFKTLGKTDAEVALIKQTAQKIDEEAKHGGNFEDLAKKNSEDDNSKAKGGDIGWIVAGQTVPAFEQAAFGLPKSGVSDVIQTPYGFDIIKVLDKETAHTKPVAEVRDSIVTLLAQQKVTQEQNDISDKMAAAVRQSSRQPIEPIAKSLNLDLGETPLVSVTEPVGDLGNAAALEEALFSLHEGELSQPIAINRGYVILQVNKITTSHQGTLAEVKNRVLADYRKEKSLELAQQEAQELAKLLKGRATIDKAAKSLGLAAKSTDPISRSSQVTDLGPMKDFEAAFNMNVGQSSDPIFAGGNWVVYQIKAKLPINPADFAKAKDSLEQQILQDKQGAAFDAFRSALEERYAKEGKLVFNTQNLKTLTSPSSS
ncbi:MAG TPA: peptidyl-prolyl cis-trans isomerase [Candidatus Acidoferrales bacterium]|nr:peptidyl-prolyl cis-trans isomerase [Candidatus Acidoferrales bacterium]